MAQMTEPNKAAFAERARTTLESWQRFNAALVKYGIRDIEKKLLGRVPKR
jgi:hypothetical protein